MVLYIGLSSFEIILVLLQPKKHQRKEEWLILSKTCQRGKKDCLIISSKESHEKKQKEAIQVLATPKATEGTTFKELAPKDFVRDLRA